MDLGTILTVAQTLFNALECSELRDLCSILGYQSEIENLAITVETVKAVLLDAEAKGDTEELSHQAQLFIEQLKDAVYEADDLLDEFVTLAQRKHKKVGASKVVPQKVRHLFSRIKDLPTAYRMSQGVKGIRMKLDAIAHNHNRFGFKLGSQPIRKRREETCSYAYAQDVIGRDDDKERIMGMLLDPTVRHDVSYLTIVGIGGLGKTTLSQLIYNDERIMKKFGKRLWACVGDEDPNHLNLKAVLAKILGSNNQEQSTLDVLQRKVREQLVVKYLLVLDDIWNENPNEWVKLENLLKGGPSGSWVIVTTRSMKTAEIIKGGALYELRGLSDKDSWHLFEMVAFDETKGETTAPNMVEIGKNIVKKCANVPLAIRVVGSLLYGQGEDKWLSFEKKGLVETNDILSILKFSYHQLDSHLKSCFSYCGLFPKDHAIEKEMLIWLWMAQGYIVPFEKDQSIEDAGEEYVLILLRRSFFQDVKKNECGEVISFKLHDLMHDVAQQMSEKEVSLDVTSDSGKQIRHLFLSRDVLWIEEFSKKNMVRTLIKFLPDDELFVDLDNWVNLRALYLYRSRIKILPNNIYKLLHLRYLDLSENPLLKVLPESLTKLYNLETLILKDCRDLIELPHNFCKLRKLRCLDMKGCDEMTHMPTGMDKLSCLHKLTMFVVDLSNQDYGDQLEILGGLTEIKDHIEIRIHGSRDDRYKKGDTTIKGEIFINKRHLSKIEFRFERDYQEALMMMEHMQPHSSLKMLGLHWYKCEKLPSWARDDNLTNSLPYLVKVEIKACHELKHLAPFEKLRHLRVLKLKELSSLEYVHKSKMDTATVDGSVSIPFLLKELELWYLPSLKGWWSSSSRRPRLSFLFPHLSKFDILDCPKLALIVVAPNVEEVRLSGVNEDLIRLQTGIDGNSRLRKVDTDNVRGLHSMLPKQAFSCVTELRIFGDDKVERLEEIREFLGSCGSSSLSFLYFGFCDNLKSVGNDKGGLNHLTSLEILNISTCHNLTLIDDSSSLSSSPLPLNLRTLGLLELPKLKNLPDWMQHLTNLQSLDINRCEALESMPKWMPHLTSLTTLEIDSCSEELEQRCRKSPPGQDWPNIQHISNLSIIEKWY